MTDRPRILLLTTYYYPILGGIETHARQLADYLRKRGFEITIVTKLLDKDSPAHEKIDGVPVYRIPPTGKSSGLQKWIMIPFAIIALFRLRDKYDLIYCPGYRGIGVAAVLTGKLLRRPVILRAGNLGILSCSNWNESLKRWHILARSKLAETLKWPFRKIYSAASAFACICREIEEEALDCNVSPERIHYLPNGVDIDRFRLPLSGERDQIRAEEGWSKDQFVCIFVGRLSIEKGILDLLETWRSIGRENKVLVIVGPEMKGHSLDVGSEVRKFVSDNGMEDQVTLYGPSEDVPRLLRAADVFVQPSHYEAFGQTVIEAMATGLPIVASRVGGMKDYLINGVNAKLCEPASPGKLAIQMHQLIEDKALREKLGKAARKTVEHEFDRTIIFKEFVRLFQRTAAA